MRVTQQRSTELLRAKRPRLTGIVGAVFAVALVVLAVLCFSVPYIAPASTAVALAIVCAAISVLALRVESRAKAELVPLRVLTIVAVGVGLVGAGIGFYLAVVQQTPWAIGAATGIFFASLVVALLGALAYGAADQRRVVLGG